MESRNSRRLLLKWSTQNPYAIDATTDSFSYDRSARVTDEVHANGIMRKLISKSKVVGFYFGFELWIEIEKGSGKYKLWKKEW